jgi:poly(A) polymerase/tRNA nucleotidyltransferase (CCA-adding enzyme)
MERPDDILIPADTPWLKDARLRRVCDALRVDGATVYFVGGCVRDALLGVPSGDVDLSTDALPDEVIVLAKAAGLKAVPTGIEHGTVTLVADGRGVEVTTFRRDVATDGRRATVAFSKDVAEDARRRDFTLNALYATPEGRVIDPLGKGVGDCLARRVRFIEDADRRIREDYLRILRYFRFHAWYVPPESGFDADTLDAIARNTDGLETLSAERQGAEMLKLLTAPDPAPAVAVMARTGVLGLILPGATSDMLAPLVHCETLLGVSPDPVTRLAALGGPDPATALRLSRKQSRFLHAIRDAASSGAPVEAIAYRAGEATALAASLLRSSGSGTPPDPDLRDRLAQAAGQTFPITAGDLMPAYEGAGLGARLRALEEHWIASGFRLSREDLMKLP